MAQSQTIIVRGVNNGILPENFKSSGQYYYKDVYNYLDGFVGTWEYVNGNEKFQLILTKIVKYHSIDTDLNLNVFEDGISVRYKRFQNGNLVYESPNTGEPILSSEESGKLDGYFVDYGRVTVQVNWPSFSGMGVLYEGGGYFYPSCDIEKLPLSTTEPERIKFNLRLTTFLGGIGNQYKNPIYNGLTLFSVPNMVIMRKIP